MFHIINNNLDYKIQYKKILKTKLKKFIDNIQDKLKITNYLMKLFFYKFLF